MSDNNSKYGWVIKLIIVGVLFYFVPKIFKKDTWDLMVCKTLMDDGVQCYDSSYVLNGYKSQRECMEVGLTIAKKEGFECGKNCKPNKDYGGTVCDIICNKGGCN